MSASAGILLKSRASTLTDLPVQSSAVHLPAAAALCLASVRLAAGERLRARVAMVRVLEITRRYAYAYRGASGRTALLPAERDHPPTGGVVAGRRYRVDEQVQGADGNRYLCMCACENSYPLAAHGPLGFGDWAKLVPLARPESALPDVFLGLYAVGADARVGLGNQPLWRVAADDLGLGEDARIECARRRADVASPGDYGLYLVHNDATADRVLSVSASLRLELAA